MTEQLTGRSCRFDLGDLKVRFTFDSPTQGSFVVVHGAGLAHAADVGDQAWGEQVAQLADEVICLPPHHPAVSPILTVVPLQLYAYFSALASGHDIDKPRNLAKSVTVM